MTSRNQVFEILSLTTIASGSLQCRQFVPIRRGHRCGGGVVVVFTEVEEIRHQFANVDVDFHEQVLLRFLFAGIGASATRLRERILLKRKTESEIGLKQKTKTDKTKQNKQTIIERKIDRERKKKHTSRKCI
jgi:hypothetical protein